MSYKSRNIDRLSKSIAIALTITVCGFLDIIKVILWPFKRFISIFRRGNFNEVKFGRDSNEMYLSLESLSKDIKSLHHQINDPIGGIKNIQDEHSKFIQKSGKNRLQCLEDNIDEVYVRLNRIKVLEDNQDIVLKKMQSMETDVKELKSGANILITCVETIEQHEKDIKALKKTVKLNDRQRTINTLSTVGGLLNNAIKKNTDKIKVLDDKVSKLQLDASDLTFLPADDDMIVRKEEYDYHQESKYWDKQVKEAYEDHMEDRRGKSGRRSSDK